MNNYKAIEELNLIDPCFYDIADMDERQLIECFGTLEQLKAFDDEFYQGLREWEEQIEQDKEECYRYTLEPPNNWAD